MKELNIEIDGRQMTAIYKPIFRHLVEIELIAPYKGLKLEFAKEYSECNLFDEAQAEVLVKESLPLLIKQVENIIRYRSIYQTINDEYKKITDIMWSVLQAMDMNSRDKFKYHCELQNRVRDEMFERLRTMIPEITENNQAEYLIYPYQLSKILSII